MIVVKIEMWPKGKEKYKYELGRTYIWNKGNHEDHPKKADYGVAVRRKNKYDLEVSQKPSYGALRVGEVNNFPRMSYNIWRLVCRALLSAFPEEKKS